MLNESLNIQQSRPRRAAFHARFAPQTRSLLAIVASTLTALPATLLAEVTEPGEPAEFSDDSARAESVRLAFEREHLPGQKEAVRVVLAQDGTMVSVYGNFDIGLDQDSARDAISLRNALAEFVSGHASEFATGTQVLDLALTRIHEIPNGLAVAHFEQFQGGLRVYDGEVTAVVAENGILHAVHGRWHPEIPHAGDVDGGVAAEDVIDVLNLEAGSALFGQTWPTTTDGSTVTTDENGNWLERVIDLSANTVVWVGQTALGTFRVDEASMTVLELRPPAYEANSSTCRVRYEDFPRDVGSGRSSSFNNTATSSYVIEEPECDYIRLPSYPSPGVCTWRLEFNNTSSHPLARIEDWNGDEVLRQANASPGQDCSAITPTPYFNSATNDSALRQQTAYVAVEGMRHFMLDNVWGEVAPDYNFEVVTTMDVEFHSMQNICHSGTAACYIPVFHEIYIRDDASDEVSTYWHEYGHSVMDSYGNVIGVGCDGIPGNSADSSWAINEAYSNIFALLNAIDDPDVDPEYGAIASLGPNNHNGPASLIDSLGDCDTDDIHSILDNHQQALWEIMFNKDCAKVNNCSDDDGDGNAIFSGSSQEQVLKFVGRAIAHALSELPAASSPLQMGTAISENIHDNFGSTTETNFDDVLQHHNVIN